MPPDTAPSGGQDRITATGEAVELVLRKHLPVPLGDTTDVLCICDVTQTYEGPVGQRLHVADELRKAGLIRA